MKYVCIKCKYKTDDKSHYTRHVKSKKHIEILLENKIITQNANEKNYTCKYCNYEYNHQSSLSRHIRECVARQEKHEKIKLEYENKLLKEKIKTKDTIKKSVEENNKFLKNMVKKRDNMLENAGKVIAKNMNILDILTNKMQINQTRVNKLHKFEKERIEEIINEDKVIQDRMRDSPEEKPFHFPEHLIYHYRHKTWLEYLSNIIVSEYKKKNPDEQAMWVSDISRLIFTVYRDPEADNDISDASSMQITDWIYDKGGICVKNLIIDPLFEYVLDRMKNYTKDIKIWIDNNWLSSKRQYKQDNLSTSLNIISEIKGKSPYKKLLKITAPQFYFDKNNEIDFS